MPRYVAQKPPGSQRNQGDRVPHSDKVDRDDPARSHILITIHRMELAGVDIDSRAVEIATQLGRWHYEAALQEGGESREVVLRRRVDEVDQRRRVYYVRCGHLIKIGTTMDLGERFRQIRPNEVLALELGGQDLETRRHREFAQLRASGEYFHPGAALQHHVLAIRQLHGAPAWTGSLVPDGHDFFPANPASSPLVKVADNL